MQFEIDSTRKAAAGYITAIAGQGWGVHTRLFAAERIAEAAKAKNPSPYFAHIGGRPVDIVQMDGYLFTDLDRSKPNGLMHLPDF